MVCLNKQTQQYIVTQLTRASTPVQCSIRDVDKTLDPGLYSEDSLDKRSRRAEQLEQRDQRNKSLKQTKKTGIASGKIRVVFL